MEITQNTAVKRLYYIDFLKFIGLTGIIIAHVSPPSWLMMLRNFDVPLMVILSSVLGAISFGRHKSKGLPVREYYFNRVKRLVFPTWIFLVVYFSIYYLVCGEVFDLKYYIASFCLTQYGIGYVWIILVYLYSALLIPLFSKIKKQGYVTIFVALIYILYELLYYFGVGINNPVIDTTFYYIVPYGALTYLGYNYSKLNKAHKFLIIAVSLFVFAGFGIYYWISLGTPQNVQIAKYPPRLYYLSFGIAVSFVLMMIFENRTLKIYSNKIVQYISKHSMWIYLWHVLVLKAYNMLDLPGAWYIKLAVVYSSAAIIVLTVNKVLDMIEKRKALKIFTYLRG